MSILRNAAEVLRCFDSATTGLTVSDVTQRLALPKANASRLLKAMRDAGLLETIGDSKRHRPGRMLLDLAAAFRSSSPVIARAGAVVSEVARQFGHTGYVSVLDRREVTAVLDFPGTNALRVVSTIGRRLSAIDSATGRSLLARLPEAEVARLYAGDARLPALLARLAEVRARGFAWSSQETTPGVDAIGIAVADAATHEAASLCIVFPTATVDAAGRAAIITALARGATAIATELNDTGFVAPRPDDAQF